MKTFGAKLNQRVENFRTSVGATLGKQRSRAHDEVSGGLRWLATTLLVAMIIAPASTSAEFAASGAVESWGFNGFRTHG